MTDPSFRARRPSALTPISAGRSAAGRVDGSWSGHVEGDTAVTVGPDGPVVSKEKHRFEEAL